MNRYEKIKALWNESKTELFATEEEAKRRAEYRTNSGEWKFVSYFKVPDGPYLVHSRNYGEE